MSGHLIIKSDEYRAKISLVCTILLSSFGTASSVLLIELGTSKITSTDISYKMAIEQAYGNARIDGTATMVSLINDVFEMEVAKLLGITAAPEEVAAFCRHVDETTKAPEILVQIKQIFQDDRSAYERLYIVPKIINQKLRAWYSRNIELHEGERDLIEKTYFHVNAGKPFEEAAQACSLEYSKIKIKIKSDTMPQLLNEHFHEMNGSVNERMQAIIESLSVGEIYSKIVEDDNGYKVVRLLHKDSTQYTVEAISIAKRPFTEWLHGQAAQISIKFIDTGLKEKIRTEYPHVWWAGSIIGVKLSTK